MSEPDNNYLLRALDGELDSFLPYAPAIVIDGPKGGVGKTGTASRHAHTKLYLDRVDQRSVVEANPDFSIFPSGTLLLDEWQYSPISGIQYVGR